MDVFWLEAQPWDYAANQATLVRVTSTDLSIAVFLGAGEYIPVLDGGPTFSTSVFGGTFTGVSESTSGQIGVLTEAGEIDAWGTYSWPSRPVRIYHAEIDLTSTIEPTVGAVELLFDGVSDAYDPDEGIITLRVLQPVGVVAQAVFAGTGGAEGTVSMTGVKKAVSIGKQRNRAPQLVDAGKLLFRCNAAGNCAQLNAIRERGVILDQPFVMHPSVDSLLNATVPPTEIHAHVSSGSFRLGFTPDGDITADFRGAMLGQIYPTNPIEIVRQLLVASGWSAAKIDNQTLSDVGSTFNYEAQFHDDSGTDILQALTGVMSGCGGYWDVDQLGVFYVGVVQLGFMEDFQVGDEGFGNYDLLDSDHLPTRAPFWRNRVGFEENSSVMSFSATETGATRDQLALIAGVKDDVDGVVEVFFQPEPPAGKPNDLWYDTDGKYWYRFVAGSGWVLTQDQDIGEAIVAAAGAQATADGKITTYSTVSAPVGASVGDLWTNPNEVPRVVRRWTGQFWDLVSTVGADINSNIYDGSGGSVSLVPRSEIRTPLGIAAAIAGQGPGATAARNDVYNDQIVLRNDGALLGGGGGQVSYGGLGGKLLGLLDSLFFGSSYLLESAGGVIASLANFKTFLGTAAGILGQGFGATASQNLVDNRTVPIGTNTIPNSDFARGGYNWLSTNNGAPVLKTLVNYPGYFSPSRSVAYARLSGTPASGAYVDTAPRGVWFNGLDEIKYDLSVRTGETVAISALVAGHRCVPQLFLLGFKADGALIWAPYTEAGSYSGGGANGEELGYMSMVFPVPDKVTRVCFMLRMFTNGEPDPFVFFAEPVLAKVRAGQNTPPPYSPGPVDPIADQTSANNAAGIFGQGALATLSSVDYATQIGSLPTALLPNVLYNGQYISAAASYYSEINTTVSSLRPGEFGSNVTETRSAASIYAQGALATQQSVNYQNQIDFLPTALLPQVLHQGQYINAAAAYYTETNVTVSSLRPGEFNANITEIRIAAAFVGQGRGATSNSLSDLDKAAADKLAGLNNGPSSVSAGYGVTIAKVLSPGQSVSLDAAVYREAGGNAGTISCIIIGGPAGVFSQIGSGPGGFVGPSEPGGDGLTMTYTNSTGVRQNFNFYVTDSRSPATAGGGIRQAGSYLIVSG